MSYRILFLTPQVPYPLHQGTTLRNFGLIEGLAKRGHQVTLATLIETGQPHPTETPLADLCQHIIAVPSPQRSTAQRLLTMLRGQADLFTRLESEALTEALRTYLADHSVDIVHFEGLEMAPFLRPVRHHAPHATLIYDAHNAEYALQARIAEQDATRLMRLPHSIYSRIQTARLRTLESTMCHQCQHVLAVSGTDAEHLKALRHTTPITVVPNAIRTANYTSEGETAEVQQPAIIFTGKMDFRPNVDAALWFAESILPLVQQAIPAAHFTIVGQKPHPRLDVLRDRTDITLTGWVEAIQPYIRAADVYAAPLRMGSGTRFKLLEAMATGRAIVSTRVGAEGLSVRDGVHLRLADEPHTFAQAVIALIQSADQRKRLIANAYELVTTRYDWSAVIPTVEDAYSNG